MTSTETSVKCPARVALLAALVLAAGAASGWPPPKKVDLHVQGGGEHHYYVVSGVEGGRFLVQRFRKAERPTYFRNFHPNESMVSVGGWAMEWDPDGKSRDVLPSNVSGVRPTRRWERPLDREGLVLRVPAGPLKGLWVGLGKLEVVKTKGIPDRELAPLVLVKDRKDAAVFTYELPGD